mgnify:FL=1
MKLFKKLAAAALAAVLALSMVGCGKAEVGTAYKTELVNMMKDSMLGTEATVENTTELDNAAQVLLANAQTEYGKLTAEQKKAVQDSQITEWLIAKDAVAKATGLKDKYCFVSFVENPNYVSNFGNQYKYVEMMRNLQPQTNAGQIVLGDNQAVVGEVANKNKTKDVKVGFASGKLGDKTYVVMVMF